MKMYEFAVTGYGAFPTDMLRYDHCKAASKKDEATMRKHTEQRTVRLVTTSPHSPTVGRWVSFLWRVEGWNPTDKKRSHVRVWKQQGPTRFATKAK